MSRTFAPEALIRTDNFIGGRWTPAADGARFAVTNPADGTLIAEVADSQAADARAATDAAAAALPAWRETLPKERAEILRRWHALILANQEALRHPHVLEEDLRRVGAAHAHLVELARHLHALAFHGYADQ